MRAGGSSPKSCSWRRAVLIGLVVAAGYLVGAFVALPDHGPTWDLVMGELPYGERLLAYVETGDEAFLDLKRLEPRPRVREPHPDFDGGRFESHEVNAFAGLASAIACRLLWTESGLVPASQAHLVVGPLFTALLLWVGCSVLARRFGVLAGVGAAAFLALSPRLFAHSVSNPRDGLEAALYALTVLAVAAALLSGQRRWWILGGIAWGLALATKANALFVPVHFAIVLVLAGGPPRRGRSLGRAWLGAALGACAAAALGALVWWLVTPSVWSDPLGGAAERLAWVAEHANPAWSAGGELASLPSFDPLRKLLLTTPLVILILAPLGFGKAGVTRFDRALLGVGIALPLVRVSLPGMLDYDGVRHYLEFAPFLAAAAGLGLARVVESARWSRLSPDARRAGRVALVASALLLPFVATLRAHPYGTAWRNAPAGFSGGALTRGLPLGLQEDYWAASLWEGLAWVSDHAEPGAAVRVPIGGHVARAMAPERLRGDVRLPLAPPTPEHLPLYVLVVAKPWGLELGLEQLRRRDEPVHTIRSQGAPLLAIYRLGPGDREALAWIADDSRSAQQSFEDLQALTAWLDRHPEIRGRIEQGVAQAAASGTPAPWAQWAEWLPPELRDELERLKGRLQGLPGLRPEPEQ